MNSSDPLSWIDRQLAELDRRNLRRRLVMRSGRQGPILTVDGRELVNFASNDYLSLAADPRVCHAAQVAIGEEGWGAGASPLIVGHTAARQRLEEELAALEATESALLFPSGYAANVGAITALAGRGDVIFSDELNHASIVDGCRLSRAQVVVYPHADTVSLQALLEDTPVAERRLIVTDSLFSMHGDFAPLAEIASLAEQYDCMLMVDEAHATGVFGQRGAGLMEQLGVEDQVHVRVGTLSKALGCSGGFVSGRDSLIQWLINRARPFVFSTAAPAANSAAALEALKIVREEPQRRRDLLERTTVLRERLSADGWNLGNSTSQIVPIFVGASTAALELSAALHERGIWAPAIRPPSVPEGQACLRISVTSAHTPEMLQQLADELARMIHERSAAKP